MVNRQIGRVLLITLCISLGALIALNYSSSVIINTSLAVYSLTGFTLLVAYLLFVYIILHPLFTTTNTITLSMLINSVLRGDITVGKFFTIVFTTKVFIDILMLHTVLFVIITGWLFSGVYLTYFTLISVVNVIIWLGVYLYALLSVAGVFYVFKRS